LTTIVLLVLVGVALPAPAGNAPVSHPTLTGPVTGGKGEPTLISTGFDLADVGYVAKEFFLEGTATAYNSATPLTSDGKWTVAPVSSAPYKTRMVVYRPAKAKDFDGTVEVEWLNVTAGFDSAAHWSLVHNAIIRAGAAWVGFSAQSVGVQGGSAAVGGVAAGGLKAADPERYGTLNHPGDIYSYDMFSQAGRAIASTGKAGPLRGFAVKRVIAAGQSQSAGRLVTYVNAVHPLAKVYDGFVIHSRSSSAAPLTQPPPAAPGTRPVSTMPSPTLIRTDTEVPVLTFQSELDAAFSFGPGVGARQPDTKKIRLWEVAGTAHYDAYGIPGLGYKDTGDGQAEVGLLDPAQLTGGILNCTAPINAGPLYLVLNAAFARMERWVRDGTPPPRATPLDITFGSPVTVNRDEHGNALGGIRSPLLDAPIATLQGVGGAGGTFCRLYGTTVPFDAATLASLYPTHAAYVAKFNQATDRAVKAGFLLPPDAKNLKAAAAKSNVGR
jgi:hypothetical protein